MEVCIEPENLLFFAGFLLLFIGLFILFSWFPSKNWKQQSFRVDENKSVENQKKNQTTCKKIRKKLQI